MENSERPHTAETDRISNIYLYEVMRLEKTTTVNLSLALFSQSSETEFLQNVKNDFIDE